MTAATLIRELADTGIRVSVTGDNLHVEAKPGTITAEVRALLVSRKPDIVAELSGIRDRLLALAAATGRASTLVDRIPVAELSLYAGMDDARLSALLGMLADDADRRAGRVPEDDTAAILCRVCGPVWVHPSLASVLPVVGGWPRALGCPWCFIRARGIAIPRPHVRCCDCRHRIPDTLNPAQGMGRCAVGNGSASWPGQRHRCGDFRPAAKGSTS